VARDVRGPQLGLVTVARDLEGAQLGFVNVAHKVNGVQLGLVNVSDEIHGGALGLVNIAGNGRIQPTLWLAGPGEAPMAGVKFLTDLTVTEVGVGYDPWQNRYRHQETLGLHLGFARSFFAELGVGYAEERYARANDDLVRQDVHYGARLGWEVINGVTPFVGGGLNERVAGRGAVVRGEYSFGLALF
jgi:hypothetical protein